MNLWLGSAALILATTFGLLMCVAGKRKNIFFSLFAQSFLLAMGAYWLSADDSAFYMLAAYLVYDAVVLFYLQSQEIVKFSARPLEKKEKIFLSFTVANAFVIFLFLIKKLFQLQIGTIEAKSNLIQVLGLELQKNSSYLYPLATAWLAAACVCALLLVRSGKDEV